MNFIDTKVDKTMKWLGLYIIGIVTWLVLSLLIYYNITEEIKVALSIGIVITAIIMFFVIKKVEVKIE